MREILQTTQIKDRDDAEGITIWNAKSMFDAARVLGAAVRHVHDRDGAALKRSGVDFNVSLVFGGQFNSGLTWRDNLRYSAGLGLSWVSPLGPMRFSFSQPLHKKSNDHLERFQFTLGTSF